MSPLPRRRPIVIAAREANGRGHHAQPTAELPTHERARIEFTKNWEMLP
jgi:hypothetical protein